MRALDHVHRELRLARAAAERAKQRVAVLQIVQLGGRWGANNERRWRRALTAFQQACAYRFVVEERDGIWEYAMRRARGAS